MNRVRVFEMYSEPDKRASGGLKQEEASLWFSTFKRRNIGLLLVSEWPAYYFPSLTSSLFLISELLTFSLVILLALSDYFPF